MKLFLYEYASAQAEAAVPAAIRREGRAMLDALIEDARGIPEVSVLTLTPRAGVGEADAFAALVNQADGCIIVAPEFDGLLQARTAWVENHVGAKGRLLSCPSVAIDAAADKLNMAGHWRACGVPTPLTWRANEEPLTGLPWVRKRRRGAGSWGTRLIQDAAMDMSDEADEWIMQEFWPGLPVSIAFLCGAADRDRLPLLPTVQRLSADGAFQYLGGRMPAPLHLHSRIITLAERALTGIYGLQGYVGVDLVMGNAENGCLDKVIEINPRLTTSYIGLRQMTATNLLDLWIRIVRGEQPAAPTWAPKTVEFDAAGQVREL